MNGEMLSICTSKRELRGSVASRGTQEITGRMERRKQLTWFPFQHLSPALAVSQPGCSVSEPAGISLLGLLALFCFSAVTAMESSWKPLLATIQGWLKLWE